MEKVWKDSDVAENILKPQKTSLFFTERHENSRKKGKKDPETALKPWASVIVAQAVWTGMMAFAQKILGLKNIIIIFL